VSAVTTAGLAAALPLAIALPIAGAVVAPLASRLSARLAVAVATLAVLGSAGILLCCAPTVYRGTVLTHYLGGWGPVDGQVLGVTVAADAWGLTGALVAAGVGALLVLSTLSGLGDLGRRELGWYACLTDLLIGAVIGGALTADLVNLFVWFEVAALASYALTGFYLERPPALEAAFKILVLTAVAGFLVFLGAALVYQRHGALNLGQIQLSVAGRPGSVVDAVAVALLLAGFATKAGLVPFHGWLPDAHTAAPGPISALFSGVMVTFGIVAIGRLTYSTFRPAHLPVLGLLMVLGLVSCLGGALFALFQDDLKRLLAYDTISQMGLLTVGLATATHAGLAGTAYHLVNHALFKTLLFLCAGAVVHATGATSLPQMAGLARRLPWVVGMFLVGVLAIAGIPPLNGYASVGLIHDGLTARHEYLPYAVTLVAQAVTTAAFIRVLVAFLRRQREDYARDERLRPGMVAALGVLGAGCLAFGLLAGPLLGHLMAPAAAALGDGPGYAHAVLSGGGRIAPVHVHFGYLSARELAGTGLTVAAAVGVTLLARRYGGARLVARVRAVQSGSVNDYAGQLTAGVALVVLAFLVL
jgi:multicomponent Na+:H+ antiporter subunit D